MFPLRTYFFVFIFLAIGSMSQEASALDNAMGIHRVDTVWDFGYTGEGISIAVLDTGIDPNHVSLNDFDDDPSTNDPKIIAFYDALDDSGDDGSGETEPYDDHGHGSHVAGIIAGTGADDEGPLSGSDAPYRGVAPGANLVGVKVLDSGGSSSFPQVMRGMEWTIDNKAKYNIKVAYIGVGVFELEITQEQEERLTTFVNEMVENGICIVMPAGNSGGYGTIDMIGAAKNVITVGATQDSKELAVYSSKGPTYEGQIKPNVAAIGSSVMSVEANSGDGYTSFSGTSMSAAIVAGISALMYEVNPDLSVDELRLILESTSEYRWSSHPVRPNNDYGWGFVNAADALDYAISFSSGMIGPSHSTQGPIDTVNYTKSETEGWNLTSSRYQVVVGTGIYFDLLNTDELVGCDLEIDFSEIVEGGDYCEENPYFFFEPGNFSFIVRMSVANGTTQPFYLHINVVENYLDYDIYSSPSHSICNTGVINFTAVNNGNFHDTAQFRISNIQELEDAGFILVLPASQYIIESGGEQLISVSVYSSEVVNVEKDYSLVLNVSTTLEGWNDSAESSTIMNFEGCSVESNGKEEEIKIPGMPIAVAGQDVSVEPGGTVQFSGAGTDDDGIIVKYEWDFDGDGVYEWSSNDNGLTTFIFNNAGTYTATLKVTDNEGNTATDSMKVTVKSPEEEGLLSSISIISAFTMIGLIAIFRRN